MKYQIKRLLRISGQVITTPFYLLYGIYWTILLLLKMTGILISLSYYRANIPQWQIEIARVFMVHGANLQVGQPVRFKVREKIVTKWVANLHYDFRNNSINTTYNHKPLKGLSERFETKSK